MPSTSGKTNDRHAPGAGGADYTLCGMALEGCVNPSYAADPVEDMPPKVTDSGEIVTCDRCRAIIDFCRTFKRYRLI